MTEKKWDIANWPILSNKIVFRLHRNGKFRSPTYHSWRMMKERCHRENRAYSEPYRKLGIAVDPRWCEPNRVGFLNFLADMGPRPEGTTLDRINPFGDYSRTNCRWATPQVQAQNKCRNYRGMQYVRPGE